MQVSKILVHSKEITSNNDKIKVTKMNNKKTQQVWISKQYSTNKKQEKWVISSCLLEEYVHKLFAVLIHWKERVVS